VLNREDIKLNYSYDVQYISNKLEDISKEIGQEALDATILLKEKVFVITDEAEGRKLDINKSYDLIKSQIEKIATEEVDLVVDIVQPEIKRSDLENIKDNLGEYSTKFNAADVDRTHNIKIATSSASDILIKPGEVYSVDKIVGPRLANYGYKEAKVIINNELVPGIGGGVCQVSSTLYNAALLSNMKIVERRNHSIPSSYIPMGRDATISENYIDLKFQNTTQYPIYIHGEVKGSWVKFSIYGRRENSGRTIKIKTEIVKKTDLMFKLNSSEMQIHLKPEFLGKMLIKVMVDDGVVTARFITENQNVKQVLEANLNSLRQSLESNGMRVEKTEVSVQLYNDGNFNNSDGGQNMWQQQQDSNRVLKFYLSN
jgi:vancomycin resistance protein YoaR